MSMITSSHVKNVLLGATAAVFVGAPLFPEHNQNGPVLDRAVTFVTGRADTAIASEAAPIPALEPSWRQPFER